MKTKIIDSTLLTQSYYDRVFSRIRIGRNETPKVALILLAATVLPACSTHYTAALNSSSFANKLNVPTEALALAPVNCEYMEIDPKIPNLYYDPSFSYGVVSLTDKAIYIAQRNKPYYVVWAWQNQYQNENQANNELGGITQIPFSEITSVAISETPFQQKQLQIFHGDKDKEKVLAIDFFYTNSAGQNDPENAKAMLSYLQNHSSAKLKTDVAFISHPIPLPTYKEPIYNSYNDFNRHDNYEDLKKLSKKEDFKFDQNKYSNMDIKLPGINDFNKPISKFNHSFNAPTFQPMMKNPITFTPSPQMYAPPTFKLNR